MNDVTGTDIGDLTRPSAEFYASPGSVVADPSLTDDQKRAILASWASDVRAIGDAPALRRLDNGAVATIDEISAALKSLDGLIDQAHGWPTRPRRPARRIGVVFRRGIRKRNGSDDDPPPCPATIAIPISQTYVPAAEQRAA